jgi:hypothetical protein
MRIITQLRLGYLFIWLLIGFSVVSVSLASWLLRDGRRAAQTAAFKPHIREYLRPPQPLPTGEHRPVSRGEFLPVDLDRQVVDELYLYLPEPMRAVRPEEVNTVVWVRRGERSLGVKRGALRFQKVWHVTAIDHPSGRLIAESDFEGPLPLNGRAVGSPPSQQAVVGWLYTLQSPPKPGKQSTK